jgi:4-hydroxybenzoate polyprenyltransferase
VAVNRLDIADPALCLAAFKSNRDAGLVLFAAIVLGGLVRQGW